MSSPSSDLARLLKLAPTDAVARLELEMGLLDAELVVLGRRDSDEPGSLVHFQAICNEAGDFIAAFITDAAAETLLEQASLNPQRFLMRGRDLFETALSIERPVMLNAGSVVAMTLSLDEMSRLLGRPFRAVTVPDSLRGEVGPAIDPPARLVDALKRFCTQTPTVTAAHFGSVRYLESDQDQFLLVIVTDDEHDVLYRINELGVETLLRDGKDLDLRVMSPADAATNELLVHVPPLT